jgi:hypothetical protein
MTLFDLPLPDEPPDRFGGRTYDPALDSGRLSTQVQRVYRLVRDGEWRTLRQIADGIGAGSEAGVSARLRDLRKPKFGSHVIERRRHPDVPEDRGLWQYRLNDPPADAPVPLFGPGARR